MPNDTELHKSAHEGDIDSCKELLEQGIDVNALGAQGRTALHRALGEGAIDVARMLVDLKADVNIIDSMQRTSLHYAALNPNDTKECVEFLFEIGVGEAMLKMQSQSLSTPLHAAVSCGHMNVAKLLAAHDANLDSIVDENGKTVLALAKECKCDKELKAAKKAGV